MLFRFGLLRKEKARVCRRCPRNNVPFWNVYPRYAYLHRTKKITVLYKALAS